MDSNASADSQDYYGDRIATSVGIGLVGVVFMSTAWIYHWWASGRGNSRILRRFPLFNRKPSSAASDRKYTACSSPECVRCQRYQIIRSSAYNKLCLYVERKHSGWVGLGRVLQAVRDGEQLHLENNNSPQQPNVLLMPFLKSSAFWLSDKFSEEKNILESNQEIIRKEFDHIYEELVSVDEDSTCMDRRGWLENNTPTGCWDVFHLYNQGTKITENCSRCPKTTSFLELLPHFMKDCLFGNASFSVIHPNTHITEHYGPSNSRIRCHMGLVVPKQCWLTVAGENKTWQKGQCIFFDDSYLHSATHAGTDQDGPRIVLLIDLWHPDITSREREALEHVF